MRRTRCGGCGDPRLDVFLDLGDSPLADKFPRPDDFANSDFVERRYPLQLAVCRVCWLVQLTEVVPGRELYADDYAFYSGASVPKVTYHQRQAATLLARHGELAQRLTVEVACNDGDLLQHFAVAGCKALGVDPAGGPVDVALGRGLHVLHAPFGYDTAWTIRADVGPAGLIIANHVAAHVEDLHDLFTGISYLLADDGVAVVESQYVGDLLTGNMFDHVYHEHRVFYSLTSMMLVAGQHDLVPVDVELVEPQGGSVQVTFARGRAGAKASPRVEALVDREKWLRRSETYAGFQGRVDRIRDRLLELLDAERSAGRRIAGYAAAAKSTTLLNYCGVGPAYLDYVVDTTPYKIGRLTPGTHVSVVAPGDEPEPDTYLLLAWNYLGPVLRREREFTASGGRWVVPIPAPVLL